ncbi:MAG TPA: methyltransferase domain-containing protein [Gammaproteobacteria bacterium]|nr:methyltransferase domain-containing protein [Gammaproteobacteria bacterium]
MSGHEAVLERYSEAAREREAALCCPVDYDTSLLELLPAEIIERDYGCGDPSRYVRPGDRVLDLGSGGGKICYMAAQLVGPEGQVIGVDMNDDMLALARRYQDEMAQRIGGDRVKFFKGYIEDLALDLEAMEAWLARHPVRTAADYTRLQAWQARQRAERPTIADASVSLVISNCVLNLVREQHRAQLIRELFRVLEPGGRVAVSDIVSDVPVPETLKQDAELWSGCVSGAFQETAFLQAFRDAGFVAVAYDKWEPRPWRVVEGIEFRSVTLTAVKPVEGQRPEQGHAVMYRGPFAEVRDDTGRVFPRGVRLAVSAEDFGLLTTGSYGDAFIGFVPGAGPEPDGGSCGGGSACCG